MGSFSLVAASYVLRKVVCGTPPEPNFYLFTVCLAAGIPPNFCSFLIALPGTRATKRAADGSGVPGSTVGETRQSKDPVPVLGEKHPIS